MRFLKSCLFLIALIVGISSCSQGKWVYTKTYHNVRTNKVQKKIANKPSTLELKPIVQLQSDSTCFEQDYIFNSIQKNDLLPSSNEELLIASIDESFLNSIVSEEKRAVNFKNKVSIIKPVFQQDCDLIIFTDGTEVQAKVLEIGSVEVKYKECSNLDGPTFSKYKNEIFMIKYANGTSTVIKKEKVNSKPADEEDAIESEFDRSQTVAFVLCLFFGALGIHRFYLGHIGMGILYLLTGGLCGIGVIVDLILIGTGNLKPKKGIYKDKW